MWEFVQQCAMPALKKSQHSLQISSATTALSCTKHFREQSQSKTSVENHHPSKHVRFKKEENNLAGEWNETWFSRIQSCLNKENPTREKLVSKVPICFPNVVFSEYKTLDNFTSLPDNQTLDLEEPKYRNTASSTHVIREGTWDFQNERNNGNISAWNKYSMPPLFIFGYSASVIVTYYLLVTDSMWNFYKED